MKGKGENKKMITNIIIAIVAVTTGIIGGYFFEKLSD
jgi:uncharacterized protein YneF (UPF0154 family)